MSLPILINIIKTRRPLGSRMVPECGNHRFGMVLQVFGMFWNPSASFLNASATLPRHSGTDRDRKRFGIEVLKVFKFGPRIFYSGRLRGDHQVFRNPSGWFWNPSGRLPRRFGNVLQAFGVCQPSRAVPESSRIDAEGFLNTPKGSGPKAECTPKVCGMSYEPLQLVPVDADTAQKIQL